LQRNKSRENKKKKSALIAAGAFSWGERQRNFEAEKHASISQQTPCRMSPLCTESFAQA